MPVYTEWGYMGALIFLVVAFGTFLIKMNTSNQQYNEKRDAEWRDFFTSLNSNNKDDICQLADTMERMVSALDKHDAQAKEIKAAVDRIEKQNTRPLPRGKTN